MNNDLQPQTWHADPHEPLLKPSDPTSLGRDIPPPKSGDTPVTAVGAPTRDAGWGWKT